VEKLLGETETGYRYLAQIASTSKRCVLREIIPDQPGGREGVARFNRAVSHVIRARPRCLTPVLEHFAQSSGSYFYAVEAPAEDRTLQAALDNKETFSEQRASNLFRALLAGLKELYALDPPVYLGALDTTKVLVAAEGHPVFLEAQFSTDSVVKNRHLSTRENFQKDLYACAFAALSAIAGGAPHGQGVAEAVWNTKGLAFSSTLDWLLLSSRNQPESLAQVEQFWDLLDSVEAAIKGGELSKALPLLEQAQHIWCAPRLVAALREVEKAEALRTAAAKAPAGPTQPEPAQKDAPPSPTPAAPKQGIAPAPPPPPPGEVSPVRPPPPPSAKPVSSFTPPKKPAVPPRAPVPGTPAAAAKTKAGPTTTGLSLVPTKVENNKWLKRSLVILIIITLGVGAWVWIARALMRNFDAALGRDQFVRPPGSSAYDFYQQAVKADGLNSSRVLAMNAKAQHRVQEWSHQQFDRWHESLDMSAGEWNDLAKAEEWLVMMSPGDVTSQGEKEYADAQVLYAHGEYAKAMAGLQRALSRIPDWDLANLSLGDSCRALKRYVCAANFYTAAKQLNANWVWPERRLSDLRNQLPPPVPTPTPVSLSPSPVQIRHFSVEPQEHGVSQAVNIRWEVINAKKVTLIGATPEPMEVRFTGSKQLVVPPGTKELRLEAEGEGTKNFDRALQLLRVRAPTIIEFRGEPNPVKFGDAFNLEWTVSDASRIHIDRPGFDDLPAQGRKPVNTQGSTEYVQTYTLTAEGTNPAPTLQTTIYVIPKIVAFIVERFAYVGNKGCEVWKVSWKVRGATKVTLDGVGMKPPLEDNYVVRPMQSRTYELKASNAAGADRRVSTVTLPPGANSCDIR
jgi:tetratricopeptide (TPR) repeat protein